MCIRDRSSIASLLEWRDKVNGSAKQAPMLKHNLEVGNVGLCLSERVKEGTKVEDINTKPFPKGDRVLVHLDELTSMRGIMSGRGHLEELTRSPEPVRSVGRGPSVQAS